MALPDETTTLPFQDQLLKLLPTPDPEALAAWQDQVLESVSRGQEAVVSAVRTWADAGKSLAPDRPLLPLADQFPAMVDVVEHSFEFLERLVTTQRDFASALLDAARPAVVVGGGAERAGTARAKATTGSAPKPAA